LAAAGGSGTTYNDVYLSNGGINYSIQAAAICAVRYGSSAVSDEWERLNVEHTQFSANVIELSGQSHFSTPHFEGLTFSNAVAEHSFIKVNSAGYSDISIQGASIQFSEFTVSGVTRVNIIEVTDGIAGNTVQLGNIQILDLTTTVGTEIHRQRIARSAKIAVSNVKEIGTTFASTSTNWDSFSDVPTCLARTLQVEDHFTSGFAQSSSRITAYGSPDTVATERYFGQWSLTRNLAAPVPDLVTDPISPNKRSGVLRLQAGTTQYMSNILTLPGAKVKVGQGPIVLRVGAALSRFGSATTDNFVFAFGLAANPSNLYGDVIMFWAPAYDASQAIKVRCSSSGTNTETSFVGGLMNTANQWEDLELIVNSDATKVSYFAASRLGRNQLSGGFITTNIPVGAVLTPFISMSKDGTAAATNDIAYFDYFRMLFNPVGLTGC
jgi:hypothetical protein